ncbi:hypothetical protein N836_34010 [Leptolyngbya sp. Heron Island J]|uniref:hypothetical protein n=1 Tax=Leptolyngbya sp. Heron Island J TaxID=1385935 RepID=UPI0003B9BF7B|nr:hypothetical protein [Leptolyngbya sp. Heron Island J]ESA38094.1 hypothetical protein N836_34010 [Leptolyngbya sp. Heron Island J]
MNIERANILAKTVPTPDFLLGDVVRTNQGIGIVIGICAWDDNEPVYVGYKVQINDPGPVVDETGDVWDTFNTQEDCVDYFYKSEELSLISRYQAGIWISVEQKSPIANSVVLGTIADADSCYAICDWDGFLFSNPDTGITLTPQPTHWANIPPMDIDPFGPLTTDPFEPGLSLV